MAEAPPIQPDSPHTSPPPDGPQGMGDSMSDQDMLWSQVWQLPVLLFGLGLLLIGVYMALPGQDPDDFHGRLANAKQLIDNNKLDEAEAVLVEVKERMNEVQAPASEEGYFWQLYADLNFERLYKTGVVGRHGVEAALPTYEKIVAYYGNAQEKGREVTGLSLRYHVLSLVALGKDEKALAILDGMSGSEASLRYVTLRDMIERRRSDSPRVDQKVLDSIDPLMKRFRGDIEKIADKGVAREQEVWADGFQASLMMQAGHPQGAINYLLRRIQRLSHGDDDDLAPLVVKLAQAYQAIDDLQNAQQHFLHAQQIVAPTDELNADILVGLGQLALSQSTGQRIEQALEYFREAEEGYPSSLDAHIAALLGRAQCEAHLGDHAAAVRYFELGVREMLARTRSWDPRREVSAKAIDTQFERAVDLDEYDRAKDYLDVLVLLEGDNPTARLLLNMALTCERIGDQRRAEAQRLTQRRPGEAPLSDGAHRLANQQAASFYAQAARYYKQHADSITIEQNDLHGESLWGSAANYDRAQMWSEAIDIYDEFIRTRDGDPKRLRAIRNLAGAYMADHRFRPALDQFQHLVEAYPRSPETYSSLVPMARCLDELGQTDRAIEVLALVIDDHEAITPESGEYQQALVSLCKLYHRLGAEDSVKYVRAIELLTEAVQRYGQTGDGPVLRYLLADANRLSVPAMDDQIATTQSQAAQIALQDERNDRLQQAQVLYNQAISGLEAKRSAQAVLDPVEVIYLRNAYFYQADCAYDRRVFEQAIQLYNTAANNYADDPASLIARIQIVNAHCELKQFQQARVANDMARRQLERIPDSAFEDESLPMKQEHWEDWLRWTSERDLFTSQPNVQEVGG
jgi:tetratricopeptide (TPR) repeat protein